MKVKKIITKITAIAMSLSLLSAGTALNASAGLVCVDPATGQNWGSHNWVFWKADPSNPHIWIYTCNGCCGTLRRQMSFHQWQKTGTRTTVVGNYVYIYGQYYCYICNGRMESFERSVHI